MSQLRDKIKQNLNGREWEKMSSNSDNYSVPKMQQG